MGNVLDAIGNTALVELRRVVPPGCARIFVKVEGQNPTGSMKDRMAQAMIAGAESDGRLKPGDTIVEYTGGSTGASLALVCAAKGYRLRIVTSDAFSEEKLAQMAAFGAELTLIPSDGGLIDKRLILAMIAAAKEISREPRTYWTDQLNNADSINGYHAMGEEIRSQTNGSVDAFVHSIGTSASLRGVATVLRRHDENVKIIAVEPGESPVLSGGQPGAHKIEGIGIDGAATCARGRFVRGNVVGWKRRRRDRDRKAARARRERRDAARRFGAQVSEHGAVSPRLISRETRAARRTRRLPAAARAACEC
jgi:cysteine synthase A